jgi:hypothetical protein
MFKKKPLCFLVFLILFVIISRQSVLAENESQQLLPPKLFEPTPVTINLYILDILSINEKDETFEVDAFLTAEWMDERLAFDSDEFGYPWKIYRVEVIQDKLKKDLWWPDLYIVDSKGPRQIINSVLVISDNGQVYYEEKFKADIKQSFSLNRFPFDHHIIQLSISSYSYTVDEVEFKLSGEPEHFEWETNEWFVFDNGNLTIGAETGYPFASYELGISRLYGFYISKFILPLVLIVTISWAVFWMDYVNINLAERLGISFTSVLTIVAFDFVSSGNLPKLSYFTILDWILTVSYLCLLIAVIENLISYQYTQKGEIEKAQRLDRISRYAFPLTFYSTIIIIIIIHTLA